MPVRVVLLTQWFEPEPTFKGLDFARELVAQGFQVEVLTGFPNYPGGKLYPGYKVKFFQRQVMDGIPVVRVPLYPSHDQGAVGRILNYTSFAATSLLYSLFMKRPDVIYAYHPPLTVGIVAVLLRLMRGIPVVYDVQDMWPDTLRATGMFSNEKALHWVDKICAWVYRGVDKIVVLSPGFRKLLIKRGVPERKVDVIYNWCSENMLPTPKEKLNIIRDKTEFSIVFAGNLGKAQALESVLAAAKLVEQKAPALRFVFLGSGLEEPRLKVLADALGCRNVAFVPRVPMAEVGTYLQEADALLVHLRKDPLFEITIPSKTQAYMAVGKPILMAVDGDAAALVRESGCGCVAESENPESIARAALSLYACSPQELEEMSENSRRYYEQNLSLKMGVGHFGKIFRKLNKRIL